MLCPRESRDLQVMSCVVTVSPKAQVAWAHDVFGNAVATTDLGDLPPEEHTLLTARNAKALLDHGFTSAYSAASAKLRLDIVIRNAIAFEGRGNHLG